MLTGSESVLISWVQGAMLQTIYPLIPWEAIDRQGLEYAVHELRRAVELAVYIEHVLNQSSCSCRQLLVVAGAGVDQLPVYFFG